MKKRKYILVCYSLFIISLFSFSQNAKIDSLHSLLKSDKEDTNKINHLNDLAWEYTNNKPDTSISYSNQALQLAEKINWQIGIVESNHNLGEFNWRKGNYTLSLAFYNKALSILDSLEKNAEINRNEYLANLKSSTLGNIGVVYRNQGNYPKALDYDFKALKIYEDIHNQHGTAIVLGSIGLIYYNQGDYPNALKYDLNALKLGEVLSDKNIISVQLGNIAIVYNDQAVSSKTQTAKDSLFNKAFGYYFKALKLKDELGNKKGMAGTLGNIGSAFSDEADKIHENNSIKKDSLKQKALIYFFKALKMSEELQDKNRIAIQLGNIGSVYIDIKKYAEAEKYLLRALSIDTAIGFLDHEEDSHEHLSTLYAKTNRYQLALEHYKHAMVLKDTLFSQDKNKEITRKEMNYEFEKKEAKVKAENEKQQAVAEAEKRKQQVILYSVIGGLLVVLIFATFIFRALRITRKQKTLIEKQKRIVEEKQKEILDSIHYARRIQNALLPTEKYIDKTLKRLLKKS